MTEPVFLLGVAPRSGTNYLEDLLAVHPDCGIGIPLREDHLLAHAQPLIRYVDSVTSTWTTKPRWGFQPGHAADLARSVGSGIIDFLVSQVDGRRRLTTPPDTLPGIDEAFKLEPRYLIAKTPRPTNLEHFHRLFPDSPLLLLVRDGRAVTESSMRSWGYSFDRAVQEWVTGARRLVDYLDTADSSKHLFLRYEDILDDPERELGRIFGYLDLDASVYDFGKALKRPVRGSSTVKPDQSGTERVSWEPVAPPSDFDPRERFSSWSDEQHARFNHLAGVLSVRLGYPLVEVEESSADRARHLLRDAAMHGRTAVKPFVPESVRRTIQSRRKV